MDLIARFDAVIADEWDPHAQPTRASIGAIESYFGMQIPKLLLDFACRSKSFSSYFLSLGPDRDSYSHIIAKNEFIRADPHWRTAGRDTSAPQYFVFITNNFMEDFFWCIDVRKPSPRYPIVYWHREEDTEARWSFVDFETWIRTEIEYYEKKRRS